MPGQSDGVPRLFENRMQAINAIAKENSEMLRLLQRLSGQDVLMMKDPESQETSDEHDAIEAEVAECKTRIDELEAELTRIDEQMEAAAKEEEQHGRE